MFFRRLVTVLVLTVAFGGLSVRAYAQTPQEITFDATRVLSAAETYGTPVYEENDGKKHYLVALSGSFVTLGGLVLWNRFLIGSAWTKVNWNHVFHFYEHKMSWDKDWYWTNFVLHPYQGALSYLAGRSANLNRIESFALATVADFAWEFFCETNAPSKNDLVYSSIGAFPVGEMLYRLSLEADQIHWLLGYVINPERMWSQLLLRQRPRGSVGNIHELSVGLSMGTTFMRTAAGQEKTLHELIPFSATPWISIVYNDPYGHDSNNPYSQFNMDISFGIGVGSGEGYGETNKNIFHDVRIISDGMLIARAPELSEHADTTVGLVFEYDFYWNNLYQLSSLAPGVAFKQRVRKDVSDIEWQAHLAGVLLGTTDWVYLYRGYTEKPDYLVSEYSYTIGAETVLRWKWKHTSGNTVAVDVHGYAMYDFANQKQSITDTGWELIGFFTANYELPLSDTVRLGVQDQVYLKKTLYSECGDVFQVANSASVYAKLQLK